jgi:CheY-like chemotaxis protein
MLRSLNHAIGPLNSSRQSNPDGLNQILNLEKALAHSNQNRQLLQRRLNDVQNLIEELITTKDKTDAAYLQSVCQLTIELGLDRVADLLEEYTWFLAEPDLLRKLSLDIVRYTLKERLDEIKETIQLLTDHHFFVESNDRPNQSPLAAKRVLLVEDMDYNRILLKKILKKLGCEVIEAINGQQAVELWRSDDRIDLIIMDMNMPIMDGFEATKTIRSLETTENRPQTPIVALTALAMRGDREKCLAAGCDEYLPKPVESGRLIKIGERLLSSSPLDFRSEIQPGSILDLKPLLIKTQNQVYRYVLQSILTRLNVAFEFCEDLLKIEEGFSSDENDILVLEADLDLELGFFFKSRHPYKYILPIFTTIKTRKVSFRANENALVYPFETGQIRAVLEIFASKLKQARQHAQEIADADSLSRIKGQTTIRDAVEKSFQQLAVWQKAFRKIGGDLVLSHQFNLHGKFGFILGDVAGHDIQSGYTASWFAGLVKGIWGQNSQPFDLLRYLNNLFAHDVEEEEKRYVCALVLLWDPLREKLYYANAGIPGGILVQREKQETRQVKWTGVPIGMFPDMDMFDHDAIDFRPGDRLYIATDGVLEAIPSDIISDIGETKRNRSPQQALESIVDFVTRSIEVTDDLTIAVFEAKAWPEPIEGFRQSITSSLESIDSLIRRIEQTIDDVAEGCLDKSMVTLAIREALINAVEHGNRSKIELPVDVDVEWQDDRLAVTISDCGGGFDLSGAKKRLQREGDLRISGRGIEMMEKIATAITYNGGGIRLIFSGNP